MEMKLYQLNSRRQSQPEPTVGQSVEPLSESQRRFYIETYGCQMNVHDTEKAASVLSGMGYRQVLQPEEADLLLLNTCMVREKPQQKVYSRVGELKRGGRGRGKRGAV